MNAFFAAVVLIVGMCAIVAVLGAVCDWISDHYGLRAGCWFAGVIGILCLVLVSVL